jgi:hypothetical protein
MTTPTAGLHAAGGLTVAVIVGLALAAAAPAAAQTTWLCNPELQHAEGNESPGQADPCLESRSATVVTYSGKKRKETIEPEAPSNGTPVDCFYVYPTVNEREGPNANPEEAGPEEKLVAREQASRFSQACRVYAPIYPQVTLVAEEPTLGDALAAYEGVKSAFEEYMAKWNVGRGFVLIGHSQGAAILKFLLREVIEKKPEWLHKLVSAILPGGEVTVKAGSADEGSFEDVPLCEEDTQTGCVIAYSSYYTEAPPEEPPYSKFTFTYWFGHELACVNPALAKQKSTSKGDLRPYVPTTAMKGISELGQSAPSASTAWIAEPGLATAQCRRDESATWLQVKLAKMSASVELERRADYEIPEEISIDGENWGLHRDDINEALGNLVGTVEAQEASYLAGR